jgi:flagellar biosynthesis/type III secretory pathway M-ring protein FliF/YscJ
MNDFIQKILGRVKDAWGKWSWPQKTILIAILAGVIVAVAALFSVSSQPTLVPVVSAPFTDETLRNRALTRIDEEGVTA